jgi:ribonuclease HI
MQARFATRCAACQGRIAVGEEIVRSSDDSAWVHVACAATPLAGPPEAAGRTGATKAGSKKAGSKKAAKVYPPDEPVPDGVTEVFTDGACRGNPGPGGWAWAVQGGPQDSGHDPATTNQRMEVRAAYEAIRALPGPLVVVSDSTYVVNCFKNSWWTGWRARGWVNSAKKPVANRDLWEPLIDLVEERGDVTFRWVKGHSGHPMNDLVDQLAVEASHQAG